MTTRRRWGRSTAAALLLGLACLACAVSARADIGVVIADPTTIGVSWFTHAGHSLVYLSQVCAASPTEARLCRPGEMGSIVTMYPDFYEEHRYAWNIVPLNLYLEGLSQPGNRLLYATPNVKAALELHARVNYLWPVCGLHGCPQRPHAYWRDLSGATVERDIFLYAVHTTQTQDEQVVRWLNASANHNAYNSLTNNCSNFTARLVNLIFPHSVHRDFLNDLGMMSPKGAARSFTRWAAKRPELGLYALHFAQQPGTVPRSTLARSGTEDGFHMKKYMIPAMLIGDHEVAGSFLVSYYLTGQFGLYKQYKRYAAPSPVVLREAASEEDPPEPAQVVAASAQLPPEVPQPDIDVSSEAVVGSSATWARYREAFQSLLQSEEAQGWTPRPKHMFPASFAKARAWVDGAGEPFLSVGGTLGTRTVGLSSENLLSDQSDPQLAFQLMLGRVASALAAKNHERETMPEFQQDWDLLMRADQRLKESETVPSGGGAISVLAEEP